MTLVRSIGRWTMTATGINERNHTQVYYSTPKRCRECSQKTKLREALGDYSDNPRFIETLHWRGFVLSRSGLGNSEHTKKTIGADRKTICLSSWRTTLHEMFAPRIKTCTPIVRHRIFLVSSSNSSSTGSHLRCLLMIRFT
jgi:hypothetical protein